jgi:hypothetical protein
VDILRTPDERFSRLSEYPFDPHYAQLGELRMHYVDRGPRDGAPVLMLHGEPSWSYLYRKMIPPFAAAGYRALAPDLIGFGRSDKPAATSDYSYQAHVDWLVTWIEQLDLRNWVFASSQKAGELPLRSSKMLETQIKPAAKAAELGEGIGWHTFRHTYSCMLRQLGVDVKVQQELLRHADIRTTMNVYTQAVSEQKRTAHSSVVRIVLPVKVGSEAQAIGHFRTFKAG